MPLYHWPCSCYPNHALNQADDWMVEWSSHDALDKDMAIQEEVRNVARSVVSAAKILRTEPMNPASSHIRSPRPK